MIKPEDDAWAAFAALSSRSHNDERAFRAGYAAAFRNCSCAAIRSVLQEMVDLMDRGDEPGSSGEWFKRAEAVLATRAIL